MTRKSFNHILKNRSEHITYIGSIRLICDQKFLNEIISSHRVMGITFTSLTFVNCQFIDIMFADVNFSSCTFTDCKFKNIYFYGMKFDNCSFKNCEILESDFSKKVDIEKSTFENCEFIKVHLMGAYVQQSTFINSKLKKVVDWKYTIFTQSKICYLDKYIEVSAEDDVKKIVDENEFES